jgi:hypothetical protein
MMFLAKWCDEPSASSGAGRDALPGKRIAGDLLGLRQEGLQRAAERDFPNAPASGELHS